MTDVLDNTADRKTVLELHREGFISAKARDAAIEMLRRPRTWWRWISRMLLIMGAALFLAGVVFFFAYNWDKMSALLKFILIEAALAACLVSAWIVRLDRLAGKLLLLGASVFTGVLLAVYGQTYQTGADPWELFLAWAVLIFGWVALSRFAAHWLTWLIILNTGIILYWAQVAMPNDALYIGSLFIVLGLIDGAALVATEYGAARGVKWLSEKWLKYVLLAAALACPTIGTMAIIIDETQRHFPGALAPVLWLAAIGLSFWYYKFMKGDLAALTMSAASVCMVAITLSGKVLFEISNKRRIYRVEPVMFLIFGVVVLVIVGVAALWLYDTHKKMRKVS